VSDTEKTSWTLIHSAAEGEASARETFARLYQPIVRAYLGARWRGSPLRSELDDAAQEVFVACLEEAGPLTRAEEGRPGGFRAFLFGVVRNVARRIEERWSRRERSAGGAVPLSAIEGRDESLSQVFDRAWALSILHRALARQADRARRKGEYAVRRVELLRLRFQEGIPIRDIARAWGTKANALHRQFLTAREEFRTALREVVREEHDGPLEDLDAECARLAQYFG
jgi:RNA polymerase sigma-70 factor (ECF subfamily)